MHLYQFFIGGTLGLVLFMLASSAVIGVVCTHVTNVLQKRWHWFHVPTRVLLGVIMALWLVMIAVFAVTGLITQVPSQS